MKSFWRLDLAYFREKKDLSFDELAGPVKKMAISQHVTRVFKWYYVYRLICTCYVLCKCCEFQLTTFM